jgi:hypothetical protein
MTRRRIVGLVAAGVAAAGVGAIVVADGNGNGDGDAGPSATDRWSSLRPALLSRTEVAAARVGRFV